MNYYFVSGTSSGIGNAIVKELLYNELNIVFGFGRTCNIRHANYNHQTIDLSDSKSLLDLEFDTKTVKGANKIVLINNSASVLPVNYVGNLNNDEIIKTYNLNLIAPTILTNNFIKAFVKNKANKIIINISSGAAENPIDGWSVYCSSKAGLKMLSEVSNLESNLKKRNIKVFSIAPGVVDTNMQTEIRNVSIENFSRLNEFKELKNDKILVTPQKVAKQYIKIIENHERYPQRVFRL